MANPLPDPLTSSTAADLADAAGAQWLYSNGVSTQTASATDARGLRLRADCGYTHVKMLGTPDSGWLQISVAIRKVEMAAAVKRLLAVAS